VNVQHKDDKRRCGTGKGRFRAVSAGWRAKGKVQVCLQSDAVSALRMVRRPIYRKEIAIFGILCDMWRNVIFLTMCYSDLSRCEATGGRASSRPVVKMENENDQSNC